jgi:hypothetical protein
VSAIVSTMSYQYPYLKDLNAGDIAQFTMWFDRNDLDFVLSHISGTWRCTAWRRGKKSGAAGLTSWSSGVCESPTTALHACYKAVRETQRVAV